MKCNHCGQADFKVVTGWESDKALQCPNKKCGQYYYYVGRILCTNWGASGQEPIAEIKKELGIE